jgi:branched-chain amino acid transport system permease protein
MDSTIVLFLLQDGITNGAIYALLGLALVLVFAVTRVIFIPQGEFVAYGALTLAMLESGRTPGTAVLLMCAGVAAFLAELWAQRRNWNSVRLMKSAALCLVLPAAIWALAAAIAPHHPGTLVKILLTLAIVTPMGPYLYRIAFQPLSGASVLVLLIAAVGVHWAMMGLGLAFFGAEGQRASPISGGGISLGPIPVSAQSIWVYCITIAIMVGLYFFFERTLLGKALRATAVNRLGARLVGVRIALSGQVAFTLAAFIGALSGVLIAPITTIYYDTGFLIGLKGFIAAVIAGLVSFPGTAVAAIIVGLVESFASFYASNFKEVILFTLIIPVLIVRSLTTKHVDDDEH